MGDAWNAAFWQKHAADIAVNGLDPLQMLQNADRGKGFFSSIEVDMEYNRI